MKRILVQHSGYAIREAAIVETRELTGIETLYTIMMQDGGFFDYEPGQFVQVSLAGVGEAPISLCSASSMDGRFQLCVRVVGRFTGAMHKLKAGDSLGIRGPFGVGFPVDFLQGKDLLLIAGGCGIAPLRSLIQYVANNRRDFGKVDILLGSKNPCSILFADDLEMWSSRPDLNCTLTVDEPEEGWSGAVGLITGLIPPLEIDPERACAVVVGPPVMYKFVIRELQKKGIVEDRIIVSLERHMKCGLGKCGHCQIHDIYCCQDGPVFFYNRIKDLRGAI